MNKLEQLKAAYEAATLDGAVDVEVRCFIDGLDADVERHEVAVGNFLGLAHITMPLLFEAVEQRDRLLRELRNVVEQRDRLIEGIEATVGWNATGLFPEDFK